MTDKLRQDMEFYSQFNKAQSDVVKNTTNVVKSTTKLCKIADPDCEACQ